VVLLFVLIRTLSIQKVETADFCAKFHVISKKMPFYGHELGSMGLHKLLINKIFFAELVRICEHETLPMLVGEYFNIIHTQ
jgi:hypothetical protein